MDRLVVAAIMGLCLVGGADARGKTCLYDMLVHIIVATLLFFTTYRV